MTLVQIRQNKDAVLKEMRAIQPKVRTVLKNGRINIPETEVLVAASGLLLTYMELRQQEENMFTAMLGDCDED